MVVTIRLMTVLVAVTVALVTVLVVVRAARVGAGLLLGSVGGGCLVSLCLRLFFLLLFFQPGLFLLRLLPDPFPRYTGKK